MMEVVTPLRLYVAGEMTGRPAFNFPVFDAAVELLEILDEENVPPGPFEAISPAELDDPKTRERAMASPDGDPVAHEGQTWGDFLARDVKIIADEADGVALLPGWENSKGARLEAFICRHVGKPVFYINDYILPHPRLDWREGTQIHPEQLSHQLYDESPCPSLIELDDAELDHVLTKADLAVLLKIEEHEDDPGALARLFNRIRPRNGASNEPAPYPEGTAPEGAPLTPGQVIARGGEVRTTSESGGQKGVKPERLDLIPPLFLEALGRVYHEGAKKYSDTNYLKGYEWRKSFGALLRHATRWNAGESIDPETGCLHLAMVAWHCATLITYEANDLGEDNRLFHAIEASQRGELK